MQTFKNFSANALYCLQVLLIFLLVFEEKTSLPAWLQSVGRMHPLLLHIPIGLLTASLALALFQKQLKPSSETTGFLWNLTALSAGATALMGFFLQREGGYSADVLAWHKWTGLALNWLCWGVFMAQGWLQKRTPVYNILLIVSFLILIITGHYEGELTHGKGYILEPLRGKQVEAAPDASAFSRVIEPVLRKKCYSCHNEQKAKGDLVMTSMETLLKGGKEGPLWKAGDTLNSHMLLRAHLPEDDKKHMPPAGKPQLTSSEIRLLSAWIQSGADMRKKLEEYPATEPFRVLAEAIAQRAAAPVKTYTFKAADPELVDKLNTPFCAVYPLALESPALCADFYVRQHFDVGQLGQLAQVKEQLVSLNLGNMPVQDADMAQIAAFVNLEKLLLNGSDVTAQGLQALKGLSALRSLSVANTKVDKGIEATLDGLPALRELFVWNSRIGPSDVEQLRSKFPQLNIHSGFVADTTEKLRLPVPILKNESNLLVDTERVVLKNPFPGAEILLSFDGSEPASSTSAIVYKEPLSIKGFTRVRAQTVKDGWLPSEPAEYFFFQKGINPASAELVYPPNEQYKGNGAANICDGKKGTADNFRDPAWLGCREQPFAAIAYFDKNSPPVASVTISCGINVGSYIMPPVKVEVWGGPDKSKLKLLQSLSPPPFTKVDIGKVQTTGLRLDVPPASYPCMKVVAIPLGKLPEWHPGKGDKGWVFVDEILFNQH